MLLLVDATLTRANAQDLTPTAPGHPLPTGPRSPTHVWDNRGTTVLVGEDAAGTTRVWTVGETELRESQLAEPVVAIDANLYDGVLALATAGGVVEVIDLSDPSPVQLLDAGHGAAVRHIRIHPACAWTSPTPTDTPVRPKRPPAEPVHLPQEQSDELRSCQRWAMLKRPTPAPTVVELS